MEHKDTKFFKETILGNSCDDINYILILEKNIVDSKFIVLCSEKVYNND